MRKLGILSLFILLSSISFGQSTIKDRRINKNAEYLLHVGDTIMFFPINPDYSGGYTTDYPCFYDVKCLESGIKSKFRFAANKQKLTPKSEIENTYFYVKKICDIDFNKKNKLAYSAILERVSDHIEICLAFPLDLTKEKESILNSWLVRPETSGIYRTVRASIVIPYLEKRFIDGIKYLEGKKIVFKQYYYRDQEDYGMLTFVNGDTKSNRLVNVHTPDVKVGTDLVAGKMDFISWDNKLVYSQPYLSVTYPADADMFRIPVTHYAGNSNKLYVIKGEIENLVRRHFIEKDNYMASLKETGPKMDSLIGRVYYFSTNEYHYKEVKGNINRNIKPVDKPDESFALADGYYKCVGFDYFPDKYSSSFYTYCAIFEDENGTRFTFPASFVYEKYGITQNIKFFNVFMSKEAKESEDRKKAEDESEKKRLLAKYGEDVGYAIWEGRCTEERYATLCKKYGKKKAGWMARRIYDIGWTYNEFLEARSPLVKLECIHTYENKSAYYEVYDYGGTYITFKNGVIVSKSNYPSSNF